MYYLFNDEITTETVNDLVSKLDTCQGDIELWFATNGGESFAMNFLVNYLNSISDRLFIVITRRLHSAGVSLLVDYEGSVKLDLDDLDSIVFHVADREIYSFRKDSTYVDGKMLAKQDREYNINFAEKIKKKGLLTDKQLKEFLRGKDVVVYKEQFEKWKL